MPLPPPVDSHRTDLARIVAGLFVLLGLTSGAIPTRIARHLHRAVVQVLRPAESAVRRLIVVLATRMKASAKPAPPPRPLPAGLVSAAAGGLILRPRFQLFDTRPRLFAVRRKPAKSRAQPRITFFGEGFVRTLSLTPPPKPAGDGLENALHLARRLQALKAALEDLPRQARRLVRAQARRQKSPRPQPKNALRPGRPPGFRQRPRADIDSILHQCEALAREALFNTS